MKVLQINAVYKNGSTGRMLFEMNEYFTAHGIESYIACPFGCGDSKNQYIIGNKIDRMLHALKSRITGRQGYGSVLETHRLIKYIKKIKPDVVHLHNLHSNYVNINMLLKFLASYNIPTVQTLHDCWNYTGKCTHYTARKCYKWQQGCGNCPNLKGDIPSWFFDKTDTMRRDKKNGYNGIKNLAVIGVSDWIANEAKKSFLSNAKLCTFIYNWIDLKTFNYKPNEVLKKSLNLENKFVILGVSNMWFESKGLNLFMELAKELEEDEVIVLVGSTNSTDLPPNVISVPPTDSLEELAEYYSSADVFMQLSKEESFGKVVAEAMACGTPVIAFDSTANSELVTEECGFLVPIADTLALKTAYKTVRKNGKEFYSEKCRQFAEENFDMTKQIEKYVEIYKRIICK